MKLNTKIVSGFMATAAVAFGIAAHAAPSGPACEPMGPGMGMMHERMSARGAIGDPAARVEQRLSRLKSQLKIDPQQEPLWAAFADQAKAEAGRGMKAMRDKAQQPLTAPERMTQMMAVMKERMSAMESVSESFKRLYDGLTPEQKAIADKQGVFGGPLMGPPMGKPKG